MNRRYKNWSCTDHLQPVPIDDRWYGMWKVYFLYNTYKTFLFNSALFRPNYSGEVECAFLENTMTWACFNSMGFMYCRNLTIFLFAPKRPGDVRIFVNKTIGRRVMKICALAIGTGRLALQICSGFLSGRYLRPSIWIPTISSRMNRRISAVCNKIPPCWIQ